MKASGDSGKRISDIIKHAIEDGVITTSEYEKILAIADEDHHIDAQERSQLQELQELLANKTIRRIPG